MITTVEKAIGVIKRVDNPITGDYGSLALSKPEGFKVLRIPTDAPEGRAAGDLE
jgi:hypothetical protein